MPPRAPFPWLTLGLVAGAVAASAGPAARAALVWSRPAIAAGEWWRLVTGNLVHFTAGHLLADALAIGLLGTLLERTGTRLALVAGVAAVAVGGTVWFGAPRVTEYGGLSGVACALAGYLTVRTRQWWLGGLLVAKLVGEAITGQGVFVTGYSLCWPAHVAGLATGLGLGAIRQPRLIWQSSRRRVRQWPNRGVLGSVRHGVRAGKREAGLAEPRTRPGPYFRPTPSWPGGVPSPREWRW